MYFTTSVRVRGGDLLIVQAGKERIREKTKKTGGTILPSFQDV